MPLLEERDGRLLEEITGTEGKGEKTKLKKGIKHCQRDKQTQKQSQRQSCMI